MPSEDTKFQILHDHYKDTFVHLREYRTLRDRLLALMLVVVTLMLFQISSPQESGDAISQFFSKRLELSNPIDISFIGSVIWFSLLALAVKYFQTVVLIEKQHKYLYMIEDQLSQHYGTAVFTREGKFYLGDYPLFSDWTHILYTGIFPILLLAVISIKIFVEFRGVSSVSVSMLFDVVIFLCILTSTLLYFLSVHFRK
jgi:hypothetical protein